jgi:hypothetical protein
MDMIRFDSTAIAIAGPAEHANSKDAGFGDLAYDFGNFIWTLHVSYLTAKSKIHRPTAGTI